MKSAKLLTLVLAPVVLAAGAYWLLASSSDQAALQPIGTPAPAPVEAAPAIEVDPTVAVPMPSPPPWMTSGMAIDASPAPDAASAERAAKAESYQKVQAELVALTANGRQPSLAEVDRVLGRIVEVEGREQVAGVDLGAVRRHMAIAAEMQQIAEEMSTLSQQDAQGNAARLQKLVERMGELRDELVASPAVQPGQP